MLTLIFLLDLSLMIRACVDRLFFRSGSAGEDVRINHRPSPPFHSISRPHMS